MEEKVNLNQDISDKNETKEEKTSLPETKIENKYDFLNFNTPSFLNTNFSLNYNLNLNTTEEEKPKEQSIFEKYSFLNNPELSDYTKSILSSYASGPRPELSDYTKAYLNSVTTSTSSVRPELSNLTKEYLSSHISGFENKDNDSKKE